VTKTGGQERQEKKATRKVNASRHKRKACTPRTRKIKARINAKRLDQFGTARPDYREYPATATGNSRKRIIGHFADYHMDPNEIQNIS
jgi:hypothetical protein